MFRLVKRIHFYLVMNRFAFCPVRKAEHHFFMEHKQNFVDSWNRSIAELTRMFARVVKCDFHAISDRESLNEAQQLIGKLRRPIGEIAATLLQENIQLADKHKNKVSANAPDVKPKQIPQQKLSKLNRSNIHVQFVQAVNVQKWFK